jgi:hypothetical protein
VHLDQTVLVRDGAVDDQEDVVVVVVELRALPEVLRVLDRERMELEHVAQDREVFLGRPVEVDPEERAAGEQALGAFAGEVDLADLVGVDDVAGRAVALGLPIRPLLGLSGRHRISAGRWSAP